MDNIFVYIILALLIMIICGLREIANNLKLNPTSFPVKIFGVDRFGSVCLILELQMVKPVGEAHYYIASYINLKRDDILGEPAIGICRLGEFKAIFAHEPSFEEIEKVFEEIIDESDG